MGRPSNASKLINESVEKQENPVSQEMDIQAIIKQAILEASKSYQEEIKELKEKLAKKENEVTTQEVVNKVENKKKYKFIPDNAKIRISSNVAGEFVFHEDRGKVRVFVQLDDYQSTTLLSYEELRVVLSTKPSFFKKGMLAITEVYADADIELEDVIIDARLEDIYFSKDKINPQNIGELFTYKVSIKEFEEKIYNTKDMAETVLEIGYVLYRKGLFNDNAKMNFLRQIFRNPNLFK